MLRAAWTTPTNLIGHAAGWLLSGGHIGRWVGGPAAAARLFPIRSGLGLDWVGAVTVGHAILHRPGLLDGPALRQRLVLAHELAHTRQHDVLGPLYLPLHILAQAVSATISLFATVRITRVHDWNPLERVLIAVPVDLTHDLDVTEADVGRLLAAFSV
jgi:hypothetical protein